MKKFIEWLEQNQARTRKVVLITTVIVFLFVTVMVFSVSMFGVVLQQSVVALYGTLSAFMIGIYGFFTGTSSDKSGALADKAADIMMSKLNSVK